LEAPNTLPMKGLFITKFESNEGKRTSVQLQVNCQLKNYKKKSPQFWWMFSLWCLTLIIVNMNLVTLLYECIKFIFIFYLTYVCIFFLKREKSKRLTQQISTSHTNDKTQLISYVMLYHLCIFFYQTLLFKLRKPL